MPKITDKNKKIIAFMLIVVISAFFITMGIISLPLNDKKKSSLEVKPNKVYSLTDKKNKKVDCELQVNKSGNYKIYVSDASVLIYRKHDSYQISTKTSNSIATHKGKNYDECYTIYLSKDYDYILTVSPSNAKSSFVIVKV